MTFFNIYDIIIKPLLIQKLKKTRKTTKTKPRRLSVNTAEETTPTTTHRHAHIDEVAVFFVMTIFGHAKRENGLTCLFNPNSKAYPDSQAIGIGRGILDEHTNGDNGRDEDSAFSKAVKQFNLEQDARIKNLQRFINRTDSGGGKHPYDLSTVVQAIHRCHP